MAGHDGTLWLGTANASQARRMASYSK